MSYKKGIDISEHNSGIDYTNFARNLDFVIIRDGYGVNSTDKLFMTHLNGFKAAQLPIIGVYHFIYATSNLQAKQNAQAAVKRVQNSGLPKTTRIWCDFEYDTVNNAAKKGVTLGPEQCRQFTKTFCDTVKAAGYPTGFYTNKDYYINWYGKEWIEDSGLPVWLADLEGGPDYPCMIHQYSWEGTVYGSDTFDMDYLTEDADLSEDIPEKAITWMEDLATDNSHGYSQYDRWGPDYDCSSAVFQAFQNAGIPVKDYAFEHDGCAFTGNLASVFEHFGFKDVTSSVNLSTGAGLKRGDVLLNHTHHVAMFCGSGREVEASISETGGVSGKTGDQTGREILIRPYRNYPWDVVLRYGDGAEEQEGDGVYMFSCKEIQKGSEGADVLLLQTLLKGKGYKGADKKVLALDGDFGANTDYALRKYQKATAGLAVDGVCGKYTWSAIVGL